MYLSVDNLRLGTTYTLIVVGYNEAGSSPPQQIPFKTKSIGKFYYDFYANLCILKYLCECKNHHHLSFSKMKEI